MIFKVRNAICTNALCFDKKNNNFIFIKIKSTNLIRGYSKIRKLFNKEKKSLNVLCRGAALRYLLTRTYDYLNTPKSAIIKKKCYYQDKESKRIYSKT
jgi:Putative homoserine kinase type II (protein kinase fold)